MKISTLIQGLSIGTVLLLAGRPAYGLSFYTTLSETQLDNDPIIDIAGYPGVTISWEGFFETTGLTANLQSVALVAIYDSNEITGLDFKRTDDDAQFFPEFSRQLTTDPSTGLTTIIGFIGGPPGLPPNFNHKFDDVAITLGSQLNNDGKADFTVGIVVNAVDANGRDVTAQFGKPLAFEVQPAAVPEPSNIFGLVLAGGFGAFFRKQNRRAQA
jgi:hypothetical protein